MLDANFKFKERSVWRSQFWDLWNSPIMTPIILLGQFSFSFLPLYFFVIILYINIYMYIALNWQKMLNLNNTNTLQLSFFPNIILLFWDLSFLFLWRFLSLIYFHCVCSWFLRWTNCVIVCFSSFYTQPRQSRHYNDTIMTEKNPAGSISHSVCDNWSVTTRTYY